MELDEDEYMHTRELHTGYIRKKKLDDCTEKELVVRCRFNERYIQKLEGIIKAQEREIQDLRRRQSVDDRDCDEEFEL